MTSTPVAYKKGQLEAVSVAEDKHEEPRHMTVNASKQQIHMTWL